MCFCGITSSIAIWSLNFWTWIAHFYQDPVGSWHGTSKKSFEARLELKKNDLPICSALFEGRHSQRSKTYCSRFGWSNIYIYLYVYIHVCIYLNMHMYIWCICLNMHCFLMLVNLAKITACKAGNGLTNCLAVLWNCVPSQELGWKGTCGSIIDVKSWYPHSSRYSRILSCLVILGLIFLESVTGGSFIFVRKHFRMFIKEIWTRSLGHHLFICSQPPFPDIQTPAEKVWLDPSKYPIKDSEFGCLLGCPWKLVTGWFHPYISRWNNPTY